MSGRLETAGSVVLVALLATSLLVPLASTPAAAEEPNFKAYVQNPTVQPGTVNQLSVQLLNEPEDPDEFADRAENVRVSLDGEDTPFEVLSGTTRVGTMVNDRPVSLSFAVRVPYDAPAGTYRLDLDVRYTEAGSNETDDATVVVEVEERPQFRIVDTESDVAVGNSGTVNVTVENVGSETATGATVQFQSSSGQVLLGGTASTSRFAGTLEPGEQTTVRADVSVARGADPQSFALQTTVTYTDADGDPGQSRTLSTGFTPAPEQEFAIEGVESSLEVGHDGTLRGTLTNRGERPVDDAVVVIRTQRETITPREIEVPVGRLGPGEGADFSFEIDVAGAAEPGSQRFSFVVEYRDRGGDLQQSETLDVTAPIREQRDTFVLEAADSDLEVGREGTLRANVTNNRDEALTDVVVRIQGTAGTVTPNEVEVPVGRLEPGEEAGFGFEMDVSEAADAGPRRFSFVIEYEDEDGDQRRTEPMDVTADVGRSVDTFQVDGVDASVDAGDGGTLTLEVTNNRDESLEDVSAKLFVDDPLSASNDQAFLGTLEPGESATATFTISAAGGALSRSYPADVDFQYRDAEGDTRLSDTYTVPVAVEESEGGGLPLPLIGGAAVALLVIAGAGYLVLRE